MSVSLFVLGNSAQLCRFYSLCEGFSCSFFSTRRAPNACFISVMVSKIRCSFRIYRRPVALAAYAQSPAGRWGSSCPGCSRWPGAARRARTRRAQGYLVFGFGLAVPGERHAPAWASGAGLEPGVPRETRAISCPSGTTERPCAETRVFQAFPTSYQRATHHNTAKPTSRQEAAGHALRSKAGSGKYVSHTARKAG